MPSAQGPLAVTGFASQGKAETRDPGRADHRPHPQRRAVEREGPGRFADEKVLVLELRNPDFNTAVSVADAINAYTQQRFGIKVAREDDLRTVTAAAAVLRRRRPLHGRDRRARCAGRRARPRRHRRAHRHHRHRQGRADLDRGGCARQPDGARHRDAQGLPAAARSRAARPSSRPTPLSPSARRAATSPSSAGTNLQTLVSGLNRIGLKPQRHHRHPAGDQVGRRAAGRPGGAMIRQRMIAGGGSNRARAERRAVRAGCRRLRWSCSHRSRLRAAGMGAGSGNGRAGEARSRHILDLRSAPRQSPRPPTSPAVEVVHEAHARGRSASPQPPRPRLCQRRASAPAPTQPMPSSAQPTAAQQYCANIANAAAEARFAWQKQALADIERSSASASRCSMPRWPSCRSG